MSIKVESMGMHEHIFTWQNPDTEEELNFASSRMIDWCAKATIPVFDTPVEVVGALMFLRDRGIETHRLERLTPEALKVPILYCHSDDGKDLLVDGHHRYVYAVAQGLRWLPAYILQPDQWKPFLITGLPKYGRDAITRGFSGIL